MTPAAAMLTDVRIDIINLRHDSRPSGSRRSNTVSQPIATRPQSGHNRRRSYALDHAAVGAEVHVAPALDAPAVNSDQMSAGLPARRADPSPAA